MKQTKPGFFDKMIVCSDKATALRDDKGRYIHSKLDSLCKCGHSLGDHAAAKAENERPCFADNCACALYKKR